MSINQKFTSPSKWLLSPALLVAVMALASLPKEAEAGCDISCAFRGVGKAFQDVGDKGIKFASQVGRQLASMSRDEFNKVKSGTNMVINESRSGLEYGYMTSINTIAGFMDDVLLDAFRSNANRFLSANEKGVHKVVTTTDKLSDQARAALKRISLAMPSKQVTSSVKADMQLIATEMGFLDAFSSMVDSSWGIGINGDVGVGPAGANSGVAIVLDVKPDSNGVINGAVVSSIGASAGLDIGAGGSVSIFWQPGRARESTGLGMGFGMSLESRYGGGGIGFSWPISIDPRDYANVMNFVKSRVGTMVPGITISVDIPGAVVTEYKASYDLNAGWSQVVTPFSINPNELCSFVTSTLVSGLTQTKVKSGSACPGASSDSI
jgi:hypothetical protein